MKTCLAIAIVAALTAGAGGCGVLPPTTDVPYPVYGNPVSPTPVRGYRVECTTVPSPTYPVFDDFVTGCRQVIPAYDPAISVRG